MASSKQGPPRPRPKPKPRLTEVTDKLPGETEAKRLGYTLYAYSGCKKTALYHKDRLSLTVYTDGMAELSRHYKMILLTTQKISFPHPRFELFENQILSLLQGVNNV